MKIVAKYDFNGGESAVKNKYAAEFIQIQSVINASDEDSDNSANLENKEL